MSHLAAQCTQLHNTYGTFTSNDHQTPGCTVTDSMQYKCVNCNKLGHVSWDRKCPAFMEHNNRLQKKNVDTNMCFYLSSRDPQYWEANMNINDHSQNPDPTPPIPRFCPSTFNPHCLNQLSQHNPVTNSNMHRPAQNDNTSYDNT